MTGRRLLIVDDDPDLGNLLGRVAEKAGYDVAITADYESFTEKYEDGLSVIVIDLVMPDLDGVDVIRFLSDRDCQAGIIVASGVDERVLRTAERLAQDRGLRVLGSLSKPFPMADLRLLLSDTVDAEAPLKRVLSGPSFEAEEMRAALEHGQFDVHYQPKVEVATRRTRGVEAVVRWEHPSHGMLCPDQFVRQAEEAGLVDELTVVVMTEAFKRARDWEDLDLSVSVNLSALSLAAIDLPERIGRLAAAAGVPAERIVLEVTETWLDSDPVTALDVLTRLKLRGFELSIDDFGTGYATLQQLRRVPFGEMKLDQSFVMGATRDTEARAIVQSSIDLGHSLGLRVVAEGVETQASWDLVHQLGCDQAQGYLIAQPMPGDEVEPWLARWLEA